MATVTPERPTSVLWLTKGLGRGGTERLAVDVALRVDPRRYTVEVAYVLPWKNSLVDELRRGGLKVHCIGDRRGALDPRWILRLRRLVRRGAGFGIVHTHAPVPALAARFLVPPETALVHTEHNVWPRYRFATRVGNAVTIKRNRVVIAVSEAVATSIDPPRFGRRPTPPVEVVVHGTALTAPSSSAAGQAGRRLLGLDPDHLVVGTVGNLTVKKRQTGLLEMMRSLASSHPRLRLVIVGDGPLAGALRAHADRLGIEDRVIFTGSRDDVAALLPAFDVFALSSEHEGLPISLLEAMATGVACVATAVGGIPEVIRDGVDGRLVISGDDAAFSSAVAGLLDDGTLRAELAAAGQVRARAFDISDAVGRTEDLYAKVLTRS